MINLIPPYAKKGLLFEYWVRVISSWSYVWSITLAAGVCVLLPAYVLIGSQVSVYEDTATAAQEKVDNYQSAAVALIEASQQAAVVINEVKQPRFSTYIERFTALEGEGVSVTMFSVSRIARDLSPVTISGVAADRQALASFRDRLLADPVVSVVDLPISNLARDKDISFTLTITLTEETR